MIDTRREEERHGDFLILHNFVARNVSMLASGYGTAYRKVPLPKEHATISWYRAKSRDSTSKVKLINVKHRKSFVMHYM